MHRFTNINTTGLVTTATFDSNDINEVNLLRRAIMNEIETWAIDTVIFDVNTTAQHDEIVAHRLGMLVLDNERFDPNAYLDEGQIRVRLDVTAPPHGGIFELTTAMAFPTVPFAYDTPILSMLPGHRLACDVIIKQGKADQHAKWRPVSIVGVNPEATGKFTIRFKSVGMLQPERILELGLDYLVSAARRPISTIFTRPVIPASISFQAEAEEAEE